jgi:endonuclease YncB( thermonuclease family)
MRTIERFKREVAGMSTGAWALVCGCSFVIAMGAGLGLLTPQWPASSSPAAPISAAITQKSPAPGSPLTGSSIAFSKCSSSREPCVVDGDTFRMNGQTIRIADIDAPETGGAKCPEEAALGNRATMRLTEILSSGPFVLQSAGSRDEDQYGRKLRLVISGGRSVGTMLVNDGLARTWTGRRRPWC